MRDHAMRGDEAGVTLVRYGPVPFRVRCGRVCYTVCSEIPHPKSHVIASDLKIAPRCEYLMNIMRPEAELRGALRGWSSRAPPSGSALGGDRPSNVPFHDREGEHDDVEREGHAKPPVELAIESPAEPRTGRRVGKGRWVGQAALHRRLSSSSTAGSQRCDAIARHLVGVRLLMA